MKKILFAFIFIPLFLGAQQTITSTIEHDGLIREYIIYIPAIYNDSAAVPLIINYHGFGSNDFEQMNYGDFRPIADTANFLVVQPQGELFNGITHWNVGGWTLGSTIDDIGFTAALIDSLSLLYNIDANRVYATGMSNGGFMSFLLACQLGDKIAAVAPVAGSMTPETYDECSPNHSVPILQFHGTSDDVVSYDGELWSKPVQDALDYWVDYNNCYPLPTITQLPDIDPNDGSTVEHIVYPSGDNGVKTEHFKIIGGGHTWPGSAFGGSGTNYDINASVEIWKFFLQYDINGLILPTSVNNKNENSNITISPNPASNYIKVNGDFENNLEYKIFSPKGDKLKNGSINKYENQIDISGLKPDIYFIKINNIAYKFLVVR